MSEPETLSPQTSFWIDWVARQPAMSVAASIRFVMTRMMPRVPVNTEFLRRVPWFEDLDNKELQTVANSAVEQSYTAGQEIVRQGDTGVGAFIISSGRVEI